jgi:hypothetical protein
VFVHDRDIRPSGRFVEVSKAIGFEPKPGQTVGLYQDNPRSLLQSRILGVELGGRALLFE